MRALILILLLSGCVTLRYDYNKRETSVGKVSESCKVVVRSKKIGVKCEM